MCIAAAATTTTTGAAATTATTTAAAASVALAILFRARHAHPWAHFAANATNPTLKLGRGWQGHLSQQGHTTLQTVLLSLLAERTHAPGPTRKPSTKNTRVLQKVKVDDGARRAIKMARMETAVPAVLATSRPSGAVRWLPASGRAWMLPGTGGANPALPRVLGAGCGGAEGIW